MSTIEAANQDQAEAKRDPKVLEAESFQKTIEIIHNNGMYYRKNFLSIHLFRHNLLSARVRSRIILRPNTDSNPKIANK